MGIAPQPLGRTANSVTPAANVPSRPAVADPGAAQRSAGGFTAPGLAAQAQAQANPVAATQYQHSAPQPRPLLQPLLPVPSKMVMAPPPGQPSQLQQPMHLQQRLQFPALQVSPQPPPLVQVSAPQPLRKLSTAITSAAAYAVASASAAPGGFPTHFQLQPVHVVGLTGSQQLIPAPFAAQPTPSPPHHSG